MSVATDLVDQIRDGNWFTVFIDSCEEALAMTPDAVVTC
jgi:hypothetical protein